jgi:hypothetical protein
MGHNSDLCIYTFARAREPVCFGFVALDRDRSNPGFGPKTGYSGSVLCKIAEQFQNRGLPGEP